MTNEPQLKKQLRARLEREGRWSDFLKAKSAYKREYHLPENVNWIAIALRFPPLDDAAKPEFKPDDLVRRMAQYAPGGGARSRPVTGDITPEQAIEAQLANMKAMSGQTKEEARRELEWEDLRKRVVAREGRKSFKKPSQSENTLWATEWCGTPPREIKASDVPGRGALQLLRTMSTDSKFYQDVARIVINKYASKDDDTSEQGIRDDDRKHLVLMKKLENYDPEVLDDVELTQILEQEAKDADTPDIIDDDSEDEFGVDPPAPVDDPEEDYGDGEEEETDPLDDVSAEGADVDQLGGDDADSA